MRGVHPDALCLNSGQVCLRCTCLLPLQVRPRVRTGGQDMWPTGAPWRLSGLLVQWRGASVGRARGVAKASPSPSQLVGRPPTEDLTSMHWRALLSTLEAFAVAQPSAMIPHLRPLTVYLALEDGSTADEQWAAVKVCRILSAVLPKAAERRGLIDHKQVQLDLQALIRNQPSSGVHEAVRCLCLTIKYITGDLAQLLVHLNSAVPALSLLCAQIEERRAKPLDRIQLMYMSRQAGTTVDRSPRARLLQLLHAFPRALADQPLSGAVRRSIVLACVRACVGSKSAGVVSVVSCGLVTGRRLKAAWTPNGSSQRSVAIVTLAVVKAPGFTVFCCPLMPVGRSLVVGVVRTSIGRCVCVCVKEVSSYRAPRSVLFHLRVARPPSLVGIVPHHLARH